MNYKLYQIKVEHKQLNNKDQVPTGSMRLSILFMKKQRNAGHGTPMMDMGGRCSPQQSAFNMVP